MEIIEGIKDAYVEVILSEEEADRLRCLALLYRNKGKNEKEKAMWEQLAKLNKRTAGLYTKR